MSQYLLRLLKERSLRFAEDGQTFTLSQGQESAVYINAKKTLLSAMGHALVGNLFYKEIMGSTFGRIRHVAGLEIGGCSIASAVSLTSYYLSETSTEKMIDALYVRKNRVKHGVNHSVVGAHGKVDDKVVVVDDVAATGTTIVEGIGELRRYGYDVAGVLVLVDRGEGAKEAVNKLGVPFHAFYEMKDLLSKDEQHDHR